MKQEKSYDGKKIAFIICVNDEVRYAECMYYIERLELPEKFQAEVFGIRDAESIFEAYNRGMEASDAKYKIYMHQDVLLLHSHMLLELVELFQAHPKVGMIGLLGCEDYPKDKRFYRAWDVGNVRGCSDKRAFHNELEKQEKKVVAIDGMFMMTQYDLPWRCDVLDGWDFYDFSQSFEFLRQGYEILVPAQQEPWSLHDCGFLKLFHYDERLEKFLRVYGSMLPEYSETDVVYKQEYREHFKLMMNLKEEMKKLVLMGEGAAVSETLSKIWDERFCDTEFLILKNILAIVEKEKECHSEVAFLEGISTFREAYEKYLLIKYNVWRKNYGISDETYDLDVSEYAKEVVESVCM